jgi:hypothetical protein
VSSIGFTAALRCETAGADDLTLKFQVTIHPSTEPRWLPPLYDEMAVIAREIKPDIGSAMLETVHGRVLLRWNGELQQGFRMPLTANTTWSAVDTVAAAQHINREKAQQVLAQAAWDQHYAPRARELVMRALVHKELDR